MEAIRKLQAKMLNLAGVVLGLVAMTAGTALAGDGWGDFTDVNGAQFKVPTYYANSPSGLLSSAACFDIKGNPPTLDANGIPSFTCDTGTALRKFIDPLPPLANPGGPAGDSSGKYIPKAVAIKWTNTQGVVTTDDYYELAVVEWKEHFHSDLANDTTIRGYVQIDPAATDAAAGLNNGATPVPGSKLYPLVNLDGTAVKISRPDGHGGFTSVNAIAVDKPHYLGPVISANQNTPTRITFYNLLPVGRASGTNRNGDIFLPVDETLPGAGFGPDGKIKYTQNRSLLHLHGGDNPWISDGTPHQWIAPAGESDVNNPSSVAAEVNAKHLVWQAELTAAQVALAALPNDAVLQQNVANLVSTEPKLSTYARGVSAINVPDMPNPGPGAMTYYYPNGETARLEWYHDHSFGLTRLNVYAGEASAYLLRDQTEAQAIADGKIPADEIPLVIQDKTFVPKNIDIQDAKWDTALWGGESDLWYPHVYELNQDPNSADGTNGVGRWDWGPYFWPVFPAFYDRLPDGSHNLATQTIAGVPADTGLTEVTTTPEAFVDTPIVNGEAYPTLTVEPKAYRFRMLNAMNDRMVNLGLYVAADKMTTNLADPLEPTKQPVVCDGTSKRADGTIPTRTDCTEVKMVNFDTSYPNLYYPTLPAAPFGANGQFAFPTSGGPNGSGWGPSGAGGGFMAINAGVPDPATIGPDIHMIGNEGGFLAGLHTIPSTIVNYENNKRSITILNVLEKGLFLGPAMRADAVIDFSQYAGKTLIVYNDAPAPLPAGDPRIDYYTGMGDFSAVGGIENVKPGYGPNDRTIMQIYVKGPNDGAVAANALDTTILATTVAAIHGQTQPAPVIPEPRYAQAFTGVNAIVANTTKETLARIYTGAIYLGKYNGLTFTTPEAIKYTAIPTIPATGAICNTPANCAANLHQGAATAAAGATISAYVESKAIQELFEPTYGRMNATLGVELPFTSSLTQTTIPLGYVDPATEKVADGETQFWKITHNGVDSHPVHFHLVNVQVINRVGWDGTLKSPTDAEIGWKETVVMNPLEDIIVAVRAKAPKLPFGLPNSVRSRDPSQANGPLVQSGFTQVDPVTGNPAVVYNKEEDFGWEYVWHCHILGHEENDFMRAFVFDYWNGKDGKDVNNVAINRPDQVLNAAVAGTVLTWNDPTPSLALATLANPKNEIGFHIVRTNPDGTTTNLEAIANQTTFVDPVLSAPAIPGIPNIYTYTVAAWNQMGAGLASAPASVELMPALPFAPTNLAVASVTSNSVNLTWTDNATNESSFKLQTSTDGVNWTTVVLPQNAGTGVVSYTVTGLLSNSNYQFQIAANNAAGDSAFTAAVPATTNTASATGLTVSGVTTTTANVAWINPNPVPGASVTTTALTVIPAATITLNGANGASISGMTPNTSYTFKVDVNGGVNGNPASTTTTATTALTALTGVTAVANGSNGATVNYTNPNGGVSTVSVVVMNGATVVQTINPATSPVNIAGLLPATQYTINVVLTGNGVTFPAITLPVTTPALLVAATNVAGKMISATQVALQWTDMSVGETGYQVLQNGVVIANVAGAANTGNTITTTVNATMPAGTLYQFTVVALEGARTGPASLAVSIDLRVRPNAVAFTNATTISGSGSVVLTWAQPAINAASIVLERRNGIFGAWVTVTTLASNVLTYTDSGLVDGTYQYRARNTNAAGNSNWTASYPAAGVVVTNTAVVLTPATNVSAYMIANNQVTVSWTDNALGETSYQVQMQRNLGGWNTLTTVPGVATSGNVLAATVTANMNGGSVYNFRVIPVAGAQVGSATTTASISLIGLPSQVAGLNATPAFGSVTLAWAQPSNNIGSIRVQRATVVNNVVGGWTTIAAALAGNSAGYVDNTVVAGTSYQYRVRTANPSGNSAYVNTATVLVPLAPPPAPADVTGVSASGAAGQIVVNFTNPNGGATAVTIVVKDSSLATISTINPAANPQVITGLLAGNYTVAVSVNGQLGLPTTVTVTVP